MVCKNIKKVSSLSPCPHLPNLSLAIPNDATWDSETLIPVMVKHPDNATLREKWFILPDSSGYSPSQQASHCA